MHVNNSKVAEIHILSLFHILTMKNFPSPSTVDLVYGMSYHQEWLVQDTWGLFFSEETLTDDVIFLKTNDGSDESLTMSTKEIIQVMGGPGAGSGPATSVTERSKILRSRDYT